MKEISLERLWASVLDSTDNIYGEDELIRVSRSDLVVVLEDYDNIKKRIDELETVNVILVKVNDLLRSTSR